MSVTEREELDPLLKDLKEKKLSFKRSVISLAAELKDVRHRLASQEQSVAREIKTRQAAETKAKTMEEEISKLQRCLEERDGQLKVSSSTNELHLRELDGLRSQLSTTQATAEASAASAKSAQSQCASLLKELDEKNSSIKEHEIRVNKLSEQLELLQMDLQARELSQRQLKDEFLRIEKEILHALATSEASKDYALRKLIDEVSPKNIETINYQLSAKDDENKKLRDEIKILSAHWKHKTAELEAQLENHRIADQELKKRVAKLEFCLQESRSQMRKFQRMGERREKVLKDLKEQLASKECCHGDEHNFWDKTPFKIILSMGILIFVAVSKR